MERVMKKENLKGKEKRRMMMKKLMAYFRRGMPMIVMMIL